MSKRSFDFKHCNFHVALCFVSLDLKKSFLYDLFLIPSVYSKKISEVIDRLLKLVKEKKRLDERLCPLVPMNAV